LNSPGSLEHDAATFTSLHELEPTKTIGQNVGPTTTMGHISYYRREMVEKGAWRSGVGGQTPFSLGRRWLN